MRPLPAATVRADRVRTVPPRWRRPRTTARVPARNVAVHVLPDAFTAWPVMLGAAGAGEGVEGGAGDGAAGAGGGGVPRDDGGAGGGAGGVGAAAIVTVRVRVVAFPSTADRVIVTV